jgi:hypothetical protein
LYAFFITRTCYITHSPHLHDLITLTILGDAYSLWSSSLDSPLQLLPLPPSQAQIFSSAPCFQTPSVYSERERSSFTPIQNNW